MPLFIAFCALVAAEIYVIILVAHATSALATVGLLLVTSLVGGVVVRREGARAWRRAAQAVEQGKAPGKQVADAALISVGGVLLIPPGFITDAIGILLVLPFTRAIFRGALGAFLVRRVTRSIGSPPAGPRRSRRRPTVADVIDGEVVDVTDRPPERPAIGEDP